MPCPVGCLGMSIKCAFGTAPTPLSVLPTSRVMVSKRPAANIFSSLAVVNILPFGMCFSPANPAFVAATAAALGVPTPVPCVPVVVSPWTPSHPTRLVGKSPVQGQTSFAMCAWAGVIAPLVPGQFQVLA